MACNVDGVAGYDPNHDVMIAELVDMDGNHVPSAGDMVRFGQYPTTIDGTGAPFVPFGIPDAQATSFDLTDTSIAVHTTGATTLVVFQSAPSIGFEDLKVIGSTSFEFFTDFVASNNDQIVVNNVFLGNDAQPGNNNFLDVQIFNLI